MTTGEKLAFLRKKKGITQEQLSEQVGVSRQSVSRWEMDAAFPETDKLIKLSRLFERSIDFLLNNGPQQSVKGEEGLSVKDCYEFIRECGYFFLATAVHNQPSLRPFGMIYAKDDTMFIVTGQRKKVYSELKRNSCIAIASYNQNIHKWIRICGEAGEDCSSQLKQELMNIYPNLRRAYQNEEEMYLAIFKFRIDDFSIM